MSNAERPMLKEEVEVRIHPNLVAWRTEFNLPGRQTGFLTFASCFCTVLILDTSDLILDTLYLVQLIKILYPHPFSEGIKPKRSRLIGTHKVHIQIRIH